MINEKIITIKINNYEEKYTFNKFARATNSSVLSEAENATILVTIAIDTQKLDDDFIPLSVQYIEKFYSGAKIPGGFIKREGKLSTNEILMSRFIDKAVRPLFPKNFEYATVITVTVLSSDRNIDMKLLTINAVNAAMINSSIPDVPCFTGLRLGRLDNELVMNPSYKTNKDTNLNLFLIGTEDKITFLEIFAKSMIIEKENGDIHQDCNEIDEKDLLSIIELGRDAISQNIKEYQEKFIDLNQLSQTTEINCDNCIEDDDYHYLIDKYKNEIEQNIKDNSQGKHKNIYHLINLIQSQEKKDNSNKNISRQKNMKIINKYYYSKVRDLILNQSKRLDNRELNEVRSINIETNILPSAHGSSLFTLNGSQVLSTVTIGSIRDAQSYEVLTSKRNLNETFMFHLNSPYYAVGEAKTIKGNSRKELEDGHYAKLSIEPTLVLMKEGVIRVVSEVLEANGGCSMLSVSAASLSLKSASINTAELVSGVSMGLVIDNDKYKILSDVTSLEDIISDARVNIAGTINGITFIQIDVSDKNISISQDMLSNIFDQSKNNRRVILDLMSQAEQNIIPSSNIPFEANFSINSRAIPVLIGKGGKNIKAIASKFSIKIDIKRNTSNIKIVGNSLKNIKEAQEYIENMAFAFLSREAEDSEVFRY